MSLVAYDEEGETPIGRAASFVSAVVAPGLHQLSALQSQQQQQQQQLQGEHHQLLRNQYELLATQQTLDAQHSALVDTVRAAQLSGEQAQQHQQQLRGEQQQQQAQLAHVAQQQDLVAPIVGHLASQQLNLHHQQQQLSSQHDILLMNQTALNNSLLQNKNEAHHAQQQTHAQIRAASAQAAGFARDASDAAVTASETQLLCVRKDMEQLWARLAELRQSLVGRDALDGARAAIAATRRSAERIEEELNDEVKLSERRYEEISTVVRANIKAVDRLMNTTNATKAAAVKLDATTQDHGAQILAQRHQFDAANEIANQQRAQQQAQLDHIIAQLQQQQQIIQQQQHDMLQLAAAASPAHPLNAGLPAPAFSPTIDPRDAEIAHLREQLHTRSPNAGSPAPAFGPTIDPRDAEIAHLREQLSHRRHRARRDASTSSSSSTSSSDDGAATDEGDETSCRRANIAWQKRQRRMPEQQWFTAEYLAPAMSREAFVAAWRERLLQAGNLSDAHREQATSLVTRLTTAYDICASLSAAPARTVHLYCKNLRLQMEAAFELLLSFRSVPSAAYSKWRTGVRNAREDNRVKKRYVALEQLLGKGEFSRQERPHRRESRSGSGARSATSRSTHFTSGRQGNGQGGSGRPGTGPAPTA